DLRGADALGCLRQSGIPRVNQRVAAQRVEGDQYADLYLVSLHRHLVKAVDSFQVHEHVRRDQALLNPSQQIAPDANGRGAAPLVPRLVEQSDRLAEVPRTSVGKGFHASTPRIWSRVIARSLIRRPIALKMALATAATEGIMGGSPSALAPNGPYGSSVST